MDDERRRLAQRQRKQKAISDTVVCKVPHNATQCTSLTNSSCPDTAEREQCCQLRYRTNAGGCLHSRLSSTTACDHSHKLPRAAGPVAIELQKLSGLDEKLHRLLFEGGRRFAINGQLQYPVSISQKCVSVERTVLPSETTYVSSLLTSRTV